MAFQALGQMAARGLKRVGWTAKFSNTTEWSPRTPWPWSKAVSITGEPLGPFVMGRKIGGKWQYRNMTDAEAQDWQEAVQSY